MFHVKDFLVAFFQRQSLSHFQDSMQIIVNQLIAWVLEGHVWILLYFIHNVFFFIDILYLEYTLYGAPGIQL